MLRNTSDFLFDIREFKYSREKCQRIMVEKKTGKKYYIDDSQQIKKDKLPRKISKTLFPIQLRIPGLIKPIFLRKSPRIFIALIPFEYMRYGNVEELMKEYISKEGKDTILNPTIRSNLIFGVASIIKKLHEHQIVLGNLFIDNVYLNDNFEPVIYNGDQTLKDFFHEQLYDYGPVRRTFKSIIPPEFMDDRYDFKTDVFMFSIFVYYCFQVFDGYFDFPNKSYYCLQNFINIKEGKRLVKNEFIPDCYWDLINKCWHQNPDERPSFKEIVEILKDDKFAINEFGMKTDLNLHHQYQNYIENCNDDTIYDFYSLTSKITNH